MAVDLRTYVFLDSLQLQNASFIATVSKGYYPVGHQACCVIEIAPGIEINRLTDIALNPRVSIIPRAAPAAAAPVSFSAMSFSLYARRVGGYFPSGQA